MNLHSSIVLLNDVKEDDEDYKCENLHSSIVLLNFFRIEGNRKGP